MDKEDSMKAEDDEDAQIYSKVSDVGLKSCIKSSQISVHLISAPVRIIIEWLARLIPPRSPCVIMQALFHTLSCEHVTIGQLQCKCEVSAAIAKKLVEKMVKEGYLESTATNRRQGRRVLRSAHTDKRLKEVNRL